MNIEWRSKRKESQIKRIIGSRGLKPSHPVPRIREKDPHMLNANNTVKLNSVN